MRQTSGFRFPLPLQSSGSGSRKTIRNPGNRPIEKRDHAYFTPPCLLVNRQHEILCIHGRTGKYLEPAPGTDARNLVAMAREGLKVHLASALRRVFEQDAAVPTPDIVCPHLRVKTNGDYRTINLRIRLLAGPPSVQGLALVVFDEVDSEPSRVQSGDAAAPTDESLLRIRELEQELGASRDYLRTTVEELETTNEELKSSNEELQSTNEELQSINEEHETSKEELQSVNEELITVNCELEGKLTELGRSNDDMANLLASTEIATLFLDRNLSIKRYTPEVVRIFRLIQSDVGRPLSDLAGSLDYPNMAEDARGVLHSLVPRIREVCTGEGRWYKVHILPYRTTGNVIDGVVITFIDTSDRKALEVQSRLATVVRDSNDAVTVMDCDGRLLAWNRGAERVYGLTESNAVGQTVFSVFADRQHDEIKRLLKRIVGGEVVERFETERELRDGRKLRVRVTATLLRDEQGRPQAVATTEHEISGSEQIPYDALRFVREMPIPVVVEDREGKVIDLNGAAERFFLGGTDRSLIGTPSASLVPGEDSDETNALLERCRLGENIRRVPGRRLVRSGDIRRVVLSMLRLSDDGCVIATVIELADAVVLE